jgi:hypothetical protein
MRSSTFIGLIVATLCAWAPAAEQPAPSSTADVPIVAAAEPNAPDPNQPWDPTRHLTAVWESVYVNMSAGLYNPALGMNVQPFGPDWSLSLDGRITIVDSNGLLGLSNSAVSAQALSQNGHVLLSMPEDSFQYRLYQPLRTTSMLTVGPDGRTTVTQMLGSYFYVDLPLDPGGRPLSVFGRIEWSVYALLAKEIKTIDIPFAVSDTWVELAPGLDILVEKAFAEEEEYQFSIKARWQTAQADYTSRGSLLLYDTMKPPATMVMNLQVLDDQGKPLAGSTGGNYTSLQGVSIGNNTGSGYGPTCGKAKTIRYTVALGVYEQPVEFAVENVPVPAYR